jgi:flagellar motor switch protein FliM
MFGEYVQQLANPTVIGIISAPPLPGHLIFEVNMDLSFALVERLLGGQGQILQKTREMTDIELVLLETLMKCLLSSLNEAWQQVSSVALNLDDLVFNPQIVQAALPADVGVLLLFELRIGEASEAISMLVPYSLLEPIIDKLTSQMWLAGIHQATVADQDGVRQQLDKVKLPVSVCLGSTAVSFRDLLELRTGNVIKLESATDEELPLFVGGNHKYYGRPGRSGRKMAVAITRILH